MRFHPALTPLCLAIALMAGGLGTHGMASNHDESSPDEAHGSPQDGTREGSQALDDDVLQEKYGITPGALKRDESGPEAATGDDGQAQSDADQAQSDADQAQSDADQAQSNADQAQRDAGQAQRDADQAQRDDRQAQRDADQAQRDQGQTQSDDGQLQDNGGQASKQDNAKEAEQDGWKSRKVMQVMSLPTLPKSKRATKVSTIRKKKCLQTETYAVSTG